MKKYIKPESELIYLYSEDEMMEETSIVVASEDADEDGDSDTRQEKTFSDGSSISDDGGFSGMSW